MLSFGEMDLILMISITRPLPTKWLIQYFYGASVIHHVEEIAGQKGMSISLSIFVYQLCPRHLIFISMSV